MIPLLVIACFDNSGFSGVVTCLFVLPLALHVN